MEHYRYFYSNPRIYLFPRCFNNLLKEETKIVEGVEQKVKKCEVQDILNTYEDSKTDNSKKFCFGEKYFKEIESRLYLDLCNYDDSTKEYTVEKKVCVGFLTKRNGEIGFVDEQAVFYALDLKCVTPGNCPVTAYLKVDDIDNSEDPTESVSVNLNLEENRIKEFSIVIKYKDSAEFREFFDYKKEKNRNLQVYIKFRNENEWKNSFNFLLYKNNEKSLDDFKQNSSNKDTDFFVLPHTTPSENQKTCIKQLQVINNQVFARNKKMSVASFKFVKEEGLVKADGTFDFTTYNDLKRNILNSISAFKTDSTNKTKGCRSGNLIEKLKTHYNYNFSNYGHNEEIITYITDNYGLPENETKGKVLDRNFLFGNYNDGDSDDKIEGIVNLYKLVVVPFVEHLTEQINLFHDFNHEWLSCPYHNVNYKRGPLTITNNMNKYIYNSGNNVINLSAIGYTSVQGNNKLPTGTIVTFKKGKDENAFKKEGEDLYEIESVTIQGKRYPSTGEFSNYKINLSLDDKKLCDDTGSPSNFGNYDGTSYTYGNYGIPYYIHITSEMPRWGTRSTKMKKSELMSWNENENNWYSYNAKPNTEQFGIDCSGFIIDAITSIGSNNNHYFTTSTLDISARDIGTTYCRKLPIINNYNTSSFLSSNDIVYTTKHIAFCIDGSVVNDFNNTYIPKNSITNRQFNICHNYGMEFIYDGNKNSNLFPIKNIQGIFRHWGVTISAEAISKSIANLGRLYLWA